MCRIKAQSAFLKPESDYHFRKCARTPIFTRVKLLEVAKRHTCKKQNGRRFQVNFNRWFGAYCLPLLASYGEPSCCEEEQHTAPHDKKSREDNSKMSRHKNGGKA